MALIYKIILLLIPILVHPSGAAAADAAELFASCIALKTIPEKSKCLSSNNLFDKSCEFESPDIVKCAELSENAIFEDSKGCNLRLGLQKISPQYLFSVTAPGKPTKDNTCKLNGNYLLQGLSPIRSMTAKIGKNKKWILDLPVLPIGLRAVLKPDTYAIKLVVSNKSFISDSRYIEDPPKFCEKTSLERLKRYYSIEGTPDDMQEMQLDRAIKFLGLKKSENMLDVERHIIGDESKSDYMVVASIALRKEIKLCGKTLEPGTRLGFQVTTFNHDSICTAAVPGVMYVSGLPLEKFPELAKQLAKKEEKRSVVCGPKAIENSLFEKVMILAQDPTWTYKAPKLDFQKCDCKIQAIPPPLPGDESLSYDNN